MKKKLYTTMEQILGFHENLVKEEKLYPKFPETLRMMRKRNLLSEKPLPVPVIEGQMSKAEFQAAYNLIPIIANPIMDSETSDKTVEESFIFPEGRDVYCVQHVHNFGVGELFVNRFFEMTYIYEGECRLLFNQEVLSLKAGDLCIIPPDTWHCIQPYANSFAYEAIIRASSFNILFNEFLLADNALGEFFRSVLLRKGHENYCILHTDSSDTELLYYLQAFTAECISGNVFSNTCSISLIKLFLVSSFRKYGKTITTGRIDNYSSRPDADSILQYIRSNFRDVSLSQLADYFHYNRTYLSRFIHSHFHRSFMEIVTEMKIDTAREYLRTSNRRVADIALLVGYDSADHFSRTFKQQEGISPITYRNMHKSGGAKATGKKREGEE